MQPPFQESHSNAYTDCISLWVNLYLIPELGLFLEQYVWHAHNVV